MQDALSRFACMPPDALDAFFKSRTKVEAAFVIPESAWLIAEDGTVSDRFVGDPDKQYFLHVDLAQKVDRCAIAIAHVEKWVLVQIGTSYKEYQPKVIVDAIRYWTPTSSKNVDFSQVRDFILSLHRHPISLNIKLVTFDRWNSTEMMDQLAVYGIKTKTLSVAKKHYQDLSLIITEERVHGPANQILIEELLQLRVVKERIDHPRKGSKDLSDAVCGAVFNAVAHTPKVVNPTVEVHSYEQLVDERKRPVARPGSVIQPPPKPKETIPEEIADFLARIDTI
jgi:hypothetical protein